MTQRELFRRGRFGMMVHWGLYSLLAGEYEGEQMGGADNAENGELGEWAMTWFRIPVKKYEKLAAAFDPVAFEAEGWARLAKEAGMNYLVVTSKHHEGFALFDSKADPYNVVQATPFGRDVIGELAKACRKYGLGLGLYYSQELDWHEPDGGGYTRGLKNGRSSWTNDWDFPDNASKDFSRCFEKKIKPQVKEILTQYGDLMLVWFDTPGVITPEQSRELYDLVKRYQPGCLVNSRIGNGMGDIISLEDNKIPAGRKSDGMLYETAATLNDTWGYKAYDQNWKSVKDCVTILTRLASRDVNYLLNVGPDPLGRIPAGAQRILKGIGAWTKRNGEMLYGAEPSPYTTELPSGPVTCRKDALYLALPEPGRELKVPGVLGRVCSASLLGGGELSFTQSGELVTVELPDLDGVLCPVVRLGMPGGVKVRQGILFPPEGSVRLSADLAEREGPITLSDAGDIEDWVDEHGKLSWSFEAPEDGSYRAEATVNGNFRALPATPEVALTVNGEERILRIRHDHDGDPLITHHHNGLVSDLGTVRLHRGENLVTLTLRERIPSDMFRFEAIVLQKL